MASTSGGVPPGFRFHPTDEELLHYYLKKKVSLQKFEMEVIREVDLNNIEPWDLQERCRIGSTPQNEWYLFSHKDKKYPTGSRTNRATSAGFWKATGRDKCIRRSLKKIGMRKTLVFYRGRAPHGQKTDWIMHEYRLEDHDEDNDDNDDQRAINPTEDGWVVCRVFKKKNPVKVGNEGAGGGSGSGLKATSCVDYRQLISGSITPITTENDHQTAARGGGVMLRDYSTQMDHHLPCDLQLRHGHGGAYAGCQHQSAGAAAAFELYKYKPAPELPLLHHHHYDPPGLAHIPNATDTTDHVDLDDDRRYHTHHHVQLQAPLGHQGRLINNVPCASRQYDKLNSNMGFDFSAGLPLDSDGSSIMINKQQAAATRDQRETSGSNGMQYHQTACEAEFNDQDIGTSYEPTRHQYQHQQRQRMDEHHVVAGRTVNRGDDQQLNEWNVLDRHLVTPHRVTSTNNHGGQEGSVSVSGSSKGDASDLLPPQLNHLSLRSEMDFWAPAYAMESSAATTTSTATAALLPNFKQTPSMD